MKDEPSRGELPVPPRGAEFGVSQLYARGAADGGVVVVVAEERSLGALRHVLVGQGYRVEAAVDGPAAARRVALGGVDLVVMEHALPRLNGLLACRQVKDAAAAEFLPVVILTSTWASESRVEALTGGADDSLGKPFDESELLARIEALLRIKRMHDRVVAEREKLEALSVYDPLTELYSPRYLYTRLAEEFKRAERYEEPLACLILDVDQLATINEGAGRSAGDEVLVSIASTLKHCLREADVVARFGSDEFFVILPNTHFAGSVSAAERIFRDLSSRPVGGRLLSVSIGAALFPSRDVRSKDALVKGASEALQSAKLDGGRRVCIYQQEGCLYTPVGAGIEPSGEVYGEAGSMVSSGGGPRSSG